MSKLYGFVAEPHRDGRYLVSPATIDNGVITCHDISGFLGSWEMRQGGVFFKSMTGDSLCTEALNLANEYAAYKNGS